MARIQNYVFRFFRLMRGMDWILLLAVFGLILLGLAAIYSVELSQDAAQFLHVKKQLVALIIGIGVFLFLAPSNYRLLQNYALILYALCCLLLIGVLVLGETIRGATGWYVIGPVSFQPVEFMKIGLLIALATYFARRGKRRFDLRAFIESGCITGIPVFLVMLQPDFGSASILMGIWGFAMLYAGIPWRYIISLIFAGVVFFVLSWNFFFADYQRARILTFLDPSLDPLGQGYNVTQAIIAVGSGGWFGSGLGFGTQSQLKFLPESQTDFIFAVIAEELGFFGAIFLCIAFGLVFYRLIKQGSQASDDFTAYLAFGIVAVFFLQFLVNVGMNLGLFPVTGIGLPFVSYGGSSLVVMLALFAFSQSIAMRQRK
ncbi:rod shape-determining protein RodA [Candidatus Uhrbacteria bacterium]|nr:rod shape-determining protein RodA [Candidatus Uhrbacteria bacterium]